MAAKSPSFVKQAIQVELSRLKRSKRRFSEVTELAKELFVRDVGRHYKTLLRSQMYRPLLDEFIASNTPKQSRNEPTELIAKLTRENRSLKANLLAIQIEREQRETSPENSNSFQFHVALEIIYKLVKAIPGLSIHEDGSRILDAFARPGEESLVPHSLMLHISSDLVRRLRKRSELELSSQTESIGVIFDKTHPTLDRE